MIKIAFLSWHFQTPEIFLNSILKMTPGRKGVWKNIKATTRIEEADFYFIMDGYNGGLPDAKNKAIYFCEHPKTPYSPKTKTFENLDAVVKLPLNRFLNPGEWWVKYDYDYLVSLKPPKKSKELIVIHTYQTHHKMYQARPKFVENLIRKYPDLDFDLYGRPKEKFLADPILKKRYKGVLGKETPDNLRGEHLIGKEILIDYKYSLEFDVGPCINYFSERLYDSFLMWCTPIYFGCQNLQYYLPHYGKAFYKFDQNRIEDVIKVKEYLKRPINLKEIAEVREILLNKYQMWAYCHHIVNNIDDYKKDPYSTFKKWIEER